MKSCLAVVLLPFAVAASADEVDFARDVRPILSGHCFKCHGPDEGKRQGGLRLDQRAGALKGGESGDAVILPHKPDTSELIKRIESADETTVMPPPETKNPLTAAQKKILRDWIAAGAEYKPHWAFSPPARPELPKTKNSDWPKNAIDAFILAKLEAAGLSPSPEADKHTLVRRAYLDLIGLPPSPEEADAFVNDAAPTAYEALIERLFQSPHYGERWARRWLDLARYADTNGYEKDRPRIMWPYRDWVINALNADLPFDQFTIEQLAGDMLPNATSQQRIATGFHRNTMINEEGGIDPLEFRFYSQVDRVNTTATTWLGLTLGCAQCHTHKFDPIPHADYYKQMAFLNNADEPEYEIPDEKIAARRRELTQQIAAAEKDLVNKFPVDGPVKFHVLKPENVVSAGGATTEILDDSSVRFSGKNPDIDSYTLTFQSPLENVTQVRLEVIADPALPSKGPGRTPHGNFVLSEITAKLAAADQPDKQELLKFAKAEADFSQDKFNVADALTPKDKTGWGIAGTGDWNVTRTATFTLAKPAGMKAGGVWTIKLDQQYGTQHTIGRLRISLGQTTSDGKPDDVSRREHRDRKFAEWLTKERARTQEWKQLVPTSATSNMPLLNILEDGSVLASSDQTKSDTYDLRFQSDLKNITAIRLEAMPDGRLPRGGPGRTYYEGPLGDFTLCDFDIEAAGKPQKIASAEHSFASGSFTAAKAIDNDKQSGWSINGGQGRTHFAVFKFATPIADASDLRLKMLFERHFCAGLGRFRIWATTNPAAGAARDLPVEIEPLLLKPDDQLTVADREKLLQQFVLVAPETANERAEIQKLRAQMPQFVRTLVMHERSPKEPRPTFMYKRGEFLTPLDQVRPELMSIFEPPAKAPHDRLTYARWLVSERNPLVGRVTMNRQWAAFFGRGLVKTTDDFGYQGDLPTHPELLDWLATELPRQGWSMKKIHKLIVMSATYRQSSRVPAAAAAKDPENKLLSHYPRGRIEAELIRDNLLKVSGLLSAKLGGPSVFPPQPASVTSEGAYGPLTWTVSTGEDRYRRGLYTFMKRTAPYAMLTTFDAPSGEACVARREVSNTPLQALMLLNDEVFLETARALGNLVAKRPGAEEDKLTYLFRRCVTRPPTTDELQMLKTFVANQRKRLEAKEIDAAAIAGPGEGPANDRAVWALLARGVMNLDEAVSKN